MPEFEIDHEPLTQLRRLDAILCRLLTMPTLTLRQIGPRDIVLLHRTIRGIGKLPAVALTAELTVVIHPDHDPRRPYYRLQFGPKIIDLASVQVVTDPNERDEWVSVRAFGAIMGLGSGCRTPALVAELYNWLTELEDECCRSSVVWYVEEGVGHVGHMAYPTELEEGDANPLRGLLTLSS